VTSLGAPLIHRRVTGSTNDDAKALAAAGAPHGTTVTADEQTVGRGRHGRRWSAPAGTALLLSVVLRETGPLLPLAAAVAVARTCGANAKVKWPNDVLLEGRKVAGILIEARPAGGWTVLGVGLNVAIDPSTFPAELRDRAGTLGLDQREIPAVRAVLLGELAQVLTLDRGAVLAAWRGRDALLGRPITRERASGIARGIDDEGGLVVELADGTHTILRSGEIGLRT
jgi:BirA family biotin operon repressor/biotin-[acetyl-CoA-carboxylase] ligase